MSFERIPEADEAERSYPPSSQDLRAFYDSWEWKRLAYRIKKRRGRYCAMCGATPRHGVRIVADHIRPVRFYWHLRLTETNIQILCDDCNRGKGSWDETDFRDEPSPIEMPCPQDLRNTIDMLVAANAPRAEIKDAVTTAYSFGAISEAGAQLLFDALGLKHA